MELHIKKLKAIRKSKKITAEELAKMMGISRMTIGAWENARRVPSESKIRILAKILHIPVSEISDLPPDKIISEIKLKSLSASISSALSGDEQKNLIRQTNLVSGITGIIKELSDLRLIVRSLISSLPTLFYIKGSDLKYIGSFSF